MNMEGAHGREERNRDEREARLVLEARRGGERAFREIVERYQPMVFAVVRGMLGDRPDVEDVVQEAFIKVYRGLAKYRGEAKLSTWVYAVARNEAADAARRGRPAAEPLDHVVLVAAEESRPDEQYAKRAERDRLERCLAELEENYRVALELRYMAEMSYNEIADTMGLPMGTVKTYIHRAKIELKRVIARQEIEAWGKRDRKP